MPWTTSHADFRRCIKKINTMRLCPFRLDMLFWGGQGIWLSSHIPPYGGKLTWRLMGSPNHGAPVFSGNKANYPNLSSRYGEQIETQSSSWSILLGQMECLPIAFWHGKYIMGKLNNAFQIMIVQKQTWVTPPLHSGVELCCFAGLCSRNHRDNVLNIIWPSEWTVSKNSQKLLRHLNEPWICLAHLREQVRMWNKPWEANKDI